MVVGVSVVVVGVGVCVGELGEVGEVAEVGMG